jgi:hypothetical protein
MKARRPSPALVISIIALVAACAGTAVAATVITTKQIKNGTIQNIDVKKGTLQSSRFSKGVQNILTKKGGSGGGSTTAFEMIRKSGPENQPANQELRVATLTVPAGAYVITANTIMTAFTGTTNVLEALFNTDSSLGGQCTLDAGGVEAKAAQNIVINDRQAPATLGMQLTRTVGAPTDIVLKCSSSIAWRTSETSIIATQVGSVNLKEEK